MLVFACSSCGAKLQMSEDLAGKKVRCASCQSVVMAPERGAGTEAISAAPPPIKAGAVTEREPTAPDRDKGDLDDLRRRRPPRGEGNTAAAVGAGMGIGAIV